MGATPGQEIELKYRFADEAVRRRYLAGRRLGPFRTGRPDPPVVMIDRYLDTPDAVIMRAGLAARLRGDGSGQRISIKSAATVPGALQQRREIEGEANESLDPRAWPPSAARDELLALGISGPLIEIVTIRQERVRRVLKGPGAELELSIDRVEVISDGVALDSFDELEVELVRGEAAGVELAAAWLASDPDLVPADGSKLERALAIRRNAGQLTDGREAMRTIEAAVLPLRSPAIESSETAPDDAAEQPPAEDQPPAAGVLERGPSGRTPGVRSEDTLAEAGKKVMRFHLDRMIAKEPGTRSGQDPEELHDMRVATRRLRAAWRVFGDAFVAAKTRRLRGRLRTVATRLGDVRDLDVLIDAGAVYQRSLTKREQQAFEPLLADWRREQEEARLLLILELDDESHRRFMRDLRAFVRSPAAGTVPPEAPTTPNRVRDTAGSRIWRAYEDVRAYESVLRWADVPTLHQLRIAAKWLRYTMEFFREALGPEAEWAIPRVVALQDHLGLLNDADVGAGRVRAFLVGKGGGLSELENATIGAYLASRERELARLRRTAGRPWRVVAGRRFRNALGRAIAGL